MPILSARVFPHGFDEKDLLPGQNWKSAIRQAIRKCDYFITLLSTKAVRKRGFVQAEQKLAYDMMDEMPETDIFIIPARIDDCDIPYHPEDRHFVNLFPDYQQGLRQILRALSPDLVNQAGVPR
ncbi:MAG: hypothetical protein B6245_09025 [Desulfobacteraceae bacterium 4572_88]|nr:MAG: hypothetical protein B6245_09025 [Desulfobacteraceae bacterium 4572_88]RLC07549.1 MAG: hypothetical protein DRI57_25765 [Deltaproteobacteria bacterium]